jgi:hypothetical protein
LYDLVICGTIHVKVHVTAKAQRLNQIFDRVT